MLLATLLERLILHIRERVRSGELSERGLARDVGMSQPHIHNVLKGVRSLSIQYADRILIHLQLTITDLLNQADHDASISDSGQERTVNVPLLRGKVGPASFLEHQPFPGDSYPVAQTLTISLTNPVLVTLGHDPSLFPFFQEGDMALVTRPTITVATLDPLALYLVVTRDGTVVRSVRLGGTRLYLITPSTRDEPRNWSELPLLGRSVEQVIRGKLVCLGRKFEGEPFGTSD